MIENTIKAKEGHVFRRISDGMVYGDEITLGFTYYIGGELLEEPHCDSASDFEEISISDNSN